MQQTTHQLAVKHAQLQRHPDLWQPAQALLWPWHTQRLRQPTTQPNRTPPSNDDLAMWRTHCTELLRNPSTFSSPAQIAQRISLALQACGMQRVCVMMLDQNAEHAKVIHLHGIRDDQLPHVFFD